jgi:hypothetical protein
MIKGILIDPKAKSVTEVESATGFDLQEIYALLGCSCITSYGIGYDNALCDDEGLLKGDEHMQSVGCYTLKGSTQSHLVGRTLVVGTGMEGETISPASTIEEIQAIVQWVDAVPTTAEMDKLMDVKFYSI